MKISILETKLASRYDEFDPEQDGNKNTKFADIIIDGRSLYQRLKNMNWYLVWDGVAMNIKDFLLNEKKLQVGPFYFDWENYKEAIENTFGTAGIQ